MSGEGGQGSAHLLGAFRESGAQDKIRAGPSVYMTGMTFQGSRHAPVVGLETSTRVFIAGAHPAMFVKTSLGFDPSTDTRAEHLLST